MDDGSKLDSRQPIQGDAVSQLMLRSLATSRLWWDIASSLVFPILEGTGRAAFALIIGQRSVVEVDSQGELRRTRLRSVLRGGVGSVSVIRTGIGGGELPEGVDEVTVLRNRDGESLGTIGVRIDNPESRWRYMDRYGYLEYIAEKLGVTAIVNTTPWMPGYVDLGQHGSVVFEAFESQYLSVDRAVLVLPHTFAIEGWLRSYVDWIRSNRPTVPSKFHEGEQWDPEAPPDPIRYAHPVPAQANFEVSALIQDGEWRDPSALEAARSLLHARYDLKIGIWDLAGNPVLRSALLAERELAVAPSKEVPIPPAAVERADAVVQQKLGQRSLMKSIVNTLEPLRAAGWQDGTYPSAQLYLPLTESFETWPGHDPSPLLGLTLTLGKRHTMVFAWTHLHNDIDLSVRLKEVRHELERSAGIATMDLDGRSPTIWKAEGGWGDDVDWATRADELVSCTHRWVELLGRVADECRRVLLQRRENWS